VLQSLALMSKGGLNSCWTQILSARPSTLEKDLEAGTQLGIDPDGTVGLREFLTAHSKLSQDVGDLLVRRRPDLLTGLRRMGSCELPVQPIADLPNPDKGLNEDDEPIIRG